MNTTANLWDILCRDLETERTGTSAKEHLRIAQKFLETAKEVFKSNGPRLCAALEIAGDICQAAGEFPDATRNFREAFAKAEETENRVAAARIAAKAALLLDQTGDSAQAREFYERALKLYEEVHDHSQHPMLLNQLASLCWAMGKQGDSAKYYMQAIDLATQLHGENHPEVATAYNNMGVACTQMGSYDKAEYLHMQALAIREKCYGSHHPEIAQSMANLAVVYHSLDKFAAAEKFYQAALKTYARFPAKSATDRATVQSNYESMQRRRARVEGAQ